MKNEVRREVGRRLRWARISAGFTQQEVATDFLASRQTVSAWERGRYFPTAGQLRELCLLYGSSADYMLFGVTAGQGGAILGEIIRRKDAADTGYTTA